MMVSRSYKCVWIRAKTHEMLRELAARENRSVMSIVEEAVWLYLNNKCKRKRWWFLG